MNSGYDIHDRVGESIIKNYVADSDDADTDLDFADMQRIIYVRYDVYGNALEQNLTDLVKRVHRGSYRPRPKREVLIPKANGKTRPIAIASFEDKLVDWVLGTLYEPLFIRNNFNT